MAFQDGALLAGGRVPDPHRPVVAAAGQQVLAVHGDRAHRVDPVLVAFQDGALASRPHSSPPSHVWGFPDIGAVGSAQVIERLGDAEQGCTLARRGDDGLGGQLQQPSASAPCRRGSVLGDLHQPPKVGMQQVSVVGEQVIDQPGSLGVAGKRAQQVTGDPLPIAEPPAPDERSRKRPLVIRLRGDVGPRVQQGVVERLVEQPVDTPVAPSCRSDVASLRLPRGSWPQRTGRTGPGPRC